MPESDHRNYREDLQRDIQFFRNKLRVTTDPKEQERLKKQLQAMQGTIPSHWNPEFNRSY
jgi:chaperonin cofactor prefoldin